MRDLGHPWWFGLFTVPYSLLLNPLYNRTHAVFR